MIFQRLVFSNIAIILFVNSFQLTRFDVSGITNMYGLKPSPANYIEPRKRPMSSMSPSIVTNKHGDAVFIVGAAGGSKITTTVAYVRTKKKKKNHKKMATNSNLLFYQIFEIRLLLDTFG